MLYCPQEDLMPLCVAIKLWKAFFCSYLSFLRFYHWLLCPKSSLGITYYVSSRQCFIRVAYFINSLKSKTFEICFFFIYGIISESDQTMFLDLIFMWCMEAVLSVTQLTKAIHRRHETLSLSLWLSQWKSKRISKNHSMIIIIIQYMLLIAINNNYRTRSFSNPCNLSVLICHYISF